MTQVDSLDYPKPSYSFSQIPNSGCGAELTVSSFYSTSYENDCKLKAIED